MAVASSSSSSSMAAPPSTSLPAGATPSRKGKERARLAPIVNSPVVTARGDFDGDDETLGGGGTTWQHRELIDSTDPSLPIVFTHDGAHFFRVRGSRLDVVSSQPPHSLASTLTSHTLAITCVTLHPTNPNLVLTGSADGTLKIWDWTDASLVRTIDVATTIREREDARREYRAKEEGKKTRSKAAGKRKRIEKIVAGKWHGKPTVWATVASESKTTIAADDTQQQQSSVPHEIVRFAIRGSALALEKLGVLPRACSSISLSPRSTYLLATSGSDAYLLALETSRWSRLSSSGGGGGGSSSSAAVSPALTCAAWCLTDGDGVPALLRGRDPEWFATGDAKGRIRLWRGALPTIEQGEQATGQQLRELVDRPVAGLTTLHWHAHAVSAIAFSSTGSQLLSAGEESVLVSWQVESLRKSFLPRLGGSGIASLAVRQQSAASVGGASAEEYWLGMRDGKTLRVVSGSLLVSEVGRTVRAPATSGALAIHRPSGSVVLPSSHPSALQFYRPTQGDVLLELEVSPSNRVSQRDDTPLEPMRVDEVEFSADEHAEWMATYERREGDAAAGGGKARAIKIWRWTSSAASTSSSQNATYMLNTRLDRAHGLANITGLAFSPSLDASASSQQPLLLTTADDGTAKIWAIRRGSAGPNKIQESAYWSLRSTFGHRGLPIHSAAFSSDGSLIALAQGPILTLWNAATNALLRVLDATDLGSAGSTRVSFVGAGGRSLAVAGPTSGLAVWDLLACEVAWSLPTQPVAQLLPLTSGDFQVAVVDHKSTQLLTFSASSADVTSRAVVPDIKLTRFVEGVAGELMATNGLGRPYCIGSRLSADFALVSNVVSSSIDRNVRQQAAASSVWEEMFGKDVFQDLSQRPEPPLDVNLGVSRSKESRSRYSSAYDGAAHTLPPARLLFESFVDDFMALSTQESTAKPEEAGKQPAHIYDETSVAVGEVKDEQAAPGPSAALSTKVDVAKWTEWFKANIDVTRPPSKSARPATLAKAAPAHEAVKQVSVANGTPVSSAKKGKKQVNGVATTPNGSLTDASPVQIGRKRKTAA